MEQEITKNKMASNARIRSIDWFAYDVVDRARAHKPKNTDNVYTQTRLNRDKLI